MKHIRLSTCGSTNDEAREALARGEAPPFVVSAAEQTQGRGRAGRSWAQLEGNFAGSFVVRLPDVIAQEPGALALLAGVSVREVMIEYGAPGEGLALKWPNDVLLFERKVAGVLADLISQGSAMIAVVGIGVNLANAPGETTGQLPAAALFPDRPPDPERFGSRLGAVILGWRARCETDGLGLLFNTWRAAAWRLGEPLTLRADQQPVTGIFRDIDRHGRLILRLPDGRERHFSAGDASSR